MLGRLSDADLIMRPGWNHHAYHRAATVVTATTTAAPLSGSDDEDNGAVTSPIKSAAGRPQVKQVRGSSKLSDHMQNLSARVVLKMLVSVPSFHKLLSVRACIAQAACQAIIMKQPFILAPLVI